MENSIRIDYSFRFSDNTLKAFNIRLEKNSLRFVPQRDTIPPAWAELGRNRCSNCTLEEQGNKYCPVALNISGTAEEFKDYFAYENVSVSVNTAERAYSKDTSIQEGLSALIGIIMVTSGCPVMEYLKPMVRFHLPFASLSETIFRMTSVYLMSQFFLKEEGRPSDWNLDRISDIYSEVSQVNRDFALRLAEAAKKDANANALVNLDCFAAMIPLATETTLREIKPYFSAYLK
jgi:hypothetical protein